MATLDDDARIGRLLRGIRRRAGVTQMELATKARVPLLELRRVEQGRMGVVRLDRIRSLFVSLDGRAKLTAWWNGAAADRLLDEHHAAIVERVVAAVRPWGWLPLPEVTFSEYGERGSIDVLAGYPAHRAVAVFEIKSEIGSLEETNRILDAKERLAPKLAQQQFGWRPAVVGRVLVLPRDMTVRRLIERHERTMRSIYPAESRAVRAWLRRPVRPIRGIWFVSDTRNTNTRTG